MTTDTLSRDVDIDLMGLMRELARRWMLLLAIPLVAGLALAIFFSSMEPRYKASTRILIENRESVFTRRDGQEFGGQPQFDEQAIGSQVQILASDDLILNVIDRLGLTAHPEFRRDADGSVMGDLAGLFSGGETRSIPVTASDRVLKAVKERMSVYAGDKSRVLFVEFWANDPALARDFPNTLAEVYLESNKAAKLRTTEEATGWLAPEIEELRGKVREAEEKVAEFRSSSDILLGNNNATLATQQLSEVSSELSRVRNERASAEGKVATMRASLANGGSVDIVPEVIASPLVQRLRERQVALEAQIAELETTLLAGHPRLKALKSQRSDLDVQVRRAARDILSSIENGVEQLRRQETLLAREVDRLKGEASRAGEAEVGLRALEREAASQRDLLASYLTRYREAAGRQSRDYLPVDARIISRAVLPTDSYFPKVVPFTVAGVVTALLLTAVGILAVALMSGKALRPVRPLVTDVPEAVPAVSVAERPLVIVPQPSEDAPVEDAPIEPGVIAPPVAVPSRVPAAAAIAVSDRTPAAPVRPRKPRDLVEVFDVQDAVAALATLKRAGIAVLSPGGEAGSATARALVRALAGRADAVLVDLTGDGVSGRAMLGTDALAGVRDIAAGEAVLEDAVYVDAESAAHVVPNGQDRPLEGELAFSNLAAMLRRLRESYAYVVIDAGYAGADSIERLGLGDVVVGVSVEGAEPADVMTLVGELVKAGHREVLPIRKGAQTGGKALSEKAA